MLGESGDCKNGDNGCAEICADYVLAGGESLVVDTLEDFRSLRAAVDDLANYSAPPVGVAGEGGVSGVMPARGAMLESMVHTAFAEVLGVPPNDFEAIQRALPQRFERKEVAGGRTVYEWKPGALVVETLLGAVKLTGNQARLYRRAKGAVEDSRALLEKMSPLIPDADEDLVDAQRAVMLDLLDHLVAELGREQEPRAIMVDRLFDSLDGELQALDRSLGYGEAEIIDLDDEEQRTYGLMLRDNIDTLHDAWQSYQNPLKGENLMLGARFRILSRTLAAVAESVQEARAMLASVRFGSAEQRTVEFKLAGELMTVDDLLSMVELFATVKAPRFIQDGKRRGVGAIRPLADQLYELIVEASRLQRHPFVRLRVQRAFEELADGLAIVRDNAAALVPDNATVPASG